MSAYSNEMKKAEDFVKAYEICHSETDLASLIKDPFSLIKEKSAAIKEQSSDICFISNMAVTAAELYMNRDPQRMTKEIYLAIIMLFFNLQQGNACAKFHYAEEIKLENLVRKALRIEDADEDAGTETHNENCSLKVRFDCRTLLDSKLFDEAYDIEDSMNHMCPFVLLKGEDEKSFSIYLRRYYIYEKSVATALSKKLSRTGDTEKFFANLGNDKLKLFQDVINVLYPCKGNEQYGCLQKIAVANAFMSDFSVISGGPGTGKTSSVLNLLLLSLICKKDEKSDPVIRMVAPTGKAAARLVESVNNNMCDLKNKIKDNAALKDQIKDGVLDAIPTSATTIHKFLGVRPNQEVPKYNRDNKAVCDILIVDEASMIPLPLFSKLLDALGDNTKLILLGDKDQLCPVEEGAVLTELYKVHQKRRIEQGSDRDKALKILTGISDFSSLEVAENLKFGYLMISDFMVVLQHSFRLNLNPALAEIAKKINSYSESDDPKNETFGSFIESIKNTESCKDPSNEISFVDVNQPLDEQSNETSESEPANKHATKNGNRIRTAGSKETKEKIVSDIADEFISKCKFYGSTKDIEDNFTLISDAEDYEKRVNDIFGCIGNYRILCEYHKGIFGTDNINELIRKLIRNKIKHSSKENKRFYPGQVIIITKNDKVNGLSNGDVGFIGYLKNSEGEQSDKADKTLKAIFLNENGKPKAIGTDRISDFDEGYAITIHKSQGSEYTNVIVALFEKDNPMITKELVYTAITRAKGYVDKNGDTVPGTVKVFCGTEAFFKGIKRSIERDSNLAEMIHK